MKGQVIAIDAWAGRAAAAFMTDGVLEDFIPAPVRLSEAPE